MMSWLFFLKLLTNKKNTPKIPVKPLPPIESWTISREVPNFLLELNFSVKLKASYSLRYYKFSMEKDNNLPFPAR